MTTSGAQHGGKGYGGQLADPEVRARRARAGGVASAAARQPEGQARRLIGRLDQISPETRRALMKALIETDSEHAYQIAIKGSVSFTVPEGVKITHANGYAVPDSE